MLTRNSVFRTPQSTPLRRSTRLLNQKTPTKSKDLNTQKAKSKEIPARSTVKISKKSIKSSNGSTNCVNSTSGLRRSPRLNSVSSKLSTNCVNSAPGLRKSPRLNSGSLSNKTEESKVVDTKKIESRKNKSIKGGLLDEEKRVVERNEREICVGLKAVRVEGGESERREICDRNEDDGVKRERERGRAARVVMGLLKGGQGSKNWLCKELIFRPSHRLIFGRRFQSWFHKNLHRIALIRSTLTI